MRSNCTSIATYVALIFMGLLMYAQWKNRPTDSSSLIENLCSGFAVLDNNGDIAMSNVC